MRKRHPPNRAEFDAAIDSSNRHLAKERVPIPERGMRLHPIIEEQLNCEILLYGELSNRIYSWLKERYGDRAIRHLTIGKSLVEIGEDLFPVRIPYLNHAPDPTYWPGPFMECAGNPEIRILREPPIVVQVLEWARDYARQRALMPSPEQGIVDVNDPLTWIEGATTSLVDSLPAEDQSRLRNYLVVAWRAFCDMLIFPREWWFADIDTAVYHLTNVNCQYGLSRWASLQAAEKTLKGFMRVLGGKPPKTHDLQQLANLAARLGLSISANFRSLEADLIARAQCSPSVRYTETVTLEEAVDAHHASLVICRCLAIELRRLG
jgi:hypothetical protein